MPKLKKTDIKSGKELLKLRKKITELERSVSEFSAVEELLADSQASIANIIEHAPDCILVVEPQKELIIKANKRARDLLKTPATEIEGKTIRDFIPVSQKRIFDNICESIKANKEHIKFETLINTAHNKQVPVEIVGFCLTLANAKYALLHFKDITEQLLTKKEHLNTIRILRTLSECNQLLVRATTEEELLNNICNAIITHGGYRAAWIGYAQDDKNKSVLPVAQAGHDQGYVNSLNISWKNTPRGRGPTGIAIRTKRVVISENIATDKRMALWRKAATKHSFGSSIALPLLDGNKAFGALNIYATEKNRFDKTDLNLLIELANDLAYGIMALRIKEEHLNNTRVLRTLSECNQLLVRAATEKELLTNLCNAIVTYGNYKAAWIGYAKEDKKKSIVPVAQAGNIQDFINCLNTTWGKTMKDDCPMSTAIKTGEITIAGDIENDTNIACCRDAALRHGFCSSIALPLKEGDKSFGAIGIYSAEKHRFNETEVALLTELANDLAFGVTALRTKVEKEKVLTTLKETERRFREIFEKVALIGDMLDTEGNITFVNDFLLDLTGWKRGEVLGKNWFKLFVSSDQLPVEKYKNSLAHGEIFKHFENDIITRKGERIPVYWSNILLRDIHGNITGVASIGEDLTERKKAEELSRETELRYTSMFEKHNAIMLLFEPETGNLVDGNESACNFYGYTKGELVSKKIYDLNILPFEEVNAAIRAVTTRKRNHFHFKHKLKDGSIRDVEVYSSPIHFGGKTILYSIIHDVTDKKLLEEKFLHSQKLEAIGRLASGVAHDMNNVLGGILSYSSAIQLTFESQSPVWQALDEINKAVARGKSLTQNLLGFARKGQYKVQPINCNMVVSNVVNMLKHSIPKKISLKINLGSNLPYIKADENQLSQALINLAINSVDALPNGGELTISTDTAIPSDSKKLLIPIESTREYVRISIQDNGSGMDKKTLDKIFEPFFTTKPVGKGTGLGLSMVYGMVKSLNGNIAIKSNPGVGTTIELYFLPADKEQKQHLATERISKKVPHINVILIVDDEEVILKGTSWLLNQLGYEVLLAKDGSIALELFRKHQSEIDLVLLDVVTPKMYGIEIMRIMREIDDTIPIVITSGHALDDSIEQMLDEGAVDFLPKPVELENFQKILSRIPPREQT